MSGVTDVRYRKVYIVKEGWVGSDSKLYFRDSAIHIYSAADGYLNIVADAGIILDANTAMLAGHQFNGAADGVVNFSKAGAISDADFTTDTTGLIGIDTTNDRIYFRTGAATWEWCAKDSGKQFQERECFLCGEKFNIGDEITYMVDKFMSDGVPHAAPVHGGCVK